MRERHNIVGSEVGRARPPIYFRAAVRRRPRAGRGWFLVALAVILVVILAGVLLAGL